MPKYSEPEAMSPPKAAAATVRSEAPGTAAAAAAAMPALVLRAAALICSISSGDLTSLAAASVSSMCVTRVPAASRRAPSRRKGSGGRNQERASTPTARAPGATSASRFAVARTGSELSG